MATTQKRIIDSLKERFNIDNDTLERALLYQKQKGLGLGEVLVDRDIIKEEDWLALLIEELNVPSIKLSRYKFDDHAIEVLSDKLARQYHILPVSVIGDFLTIVTSDPLNVNIIDDLEHLTNKKIEVVVTTRTDIKEALDDVYGSLDEHTVSELSQNIDIGDFEIISGDQNDDEADADAGEQAPIIRMVNLIIREALSQRASDIHMEPLEDAMRVRYRIDGVLQDILEVPKENQNAIIVRLKIMARMDITVTQIPQDGRFKMRLGRQEVDFRVSMLPTSFGQKVVMRVLDKKNLSIGLEKLGFSKRSADLLDDCMTKPFGMILVTGPTGSGKSTTLYSIINKLNTVDKNIITVEEPVEYLVEGLTQIDVRPEIGLTFASGLRSILRQSPDIVMVGEIRDNETADIAIKASLTGQLVFSTLHTNDASSSLTRLVDMGVEPFLVASSLLLICAQRLCRRTCPDCKEEIDVPKKVIDKLGNDIPESAKFYEGKGCDKCRGTGYQGRFGITEVLVVDDSIRELLLEGKSSDAIKAHARVHQGMKLLWDDALDRLLAGDTTVTEVLRIAADEL